LVETVTGVFETRNLPVKALATKCWAQ